MGDEGGAVAGPHTPRKNLGQRFSTSAWVAVVFGAIAGFCAPASKRTTLRSGYASTSMVQEPTPFLAITLIAGVIAIIGLGFLIGTIRDLIRLAESSRT